MLIVASKTAPRAGGKHDYMYIWSYRDWDRDITVWRVYKYICIYEMRGVFIQSNIYYYIFWQQGSLEMSTINSHNWAHSLTSGLCGTKQDNQIKFKKTLIRRHSTIHALYDKLDWTYNNSYLQQNKVQNVFSVNTEMQLSSVHYDDVTVSVNMYFYH